MTTHSSPDIVAIPMKRPPHHILLGDPEAVAAEKRRGGA